MRNKLKYWLDTTGLEDDREKHLFGGDAVFCLFYGQTINQLINFHFIVKIYLIISQHDGYLSIIIIFHCI